MSSLKMPTDLPNLIALFDCKEVVWYLFYFSTQNCLNINSILELKWFYVTKSWWWLSQVKECYENS